MRYQLDTTATDGKIPFAEQLTDSRSCVLLCLKEGDSGHSLEEDLGLVSEVR